MGASYDQKDAEGFIRILGLPSRCRAEVQTASQAAPQKTPTKVEVA